MSDRLDWVRFQQVFGCGSTRGRKVLDHFGSPGAFLAQRPGEMARLGLNQRELERLGTVGSEEAAQKILDRCRALGCKALIPEDPGYPQRLREIYNYPAVLYLQGDLDGLDQKLAIAMVGTRNCTDYGRRAARAIAEGLAEKGAVIVSGLARGIDTVSHEATLRAGGRTVAVLGCGVDIVYPPENARLEKQILRHGGAVVSEYPPGTRPLPRHFPIRNRVISGLSNGVVVVEGTRRSGSLITASHAFTQSREVFAVPGDIFSRTSEGPNYLLRQSAKAVDGLESILEEFQFLIQWVPAEGTEEKTLFEESEQKGYNGGQRPLGESPRPERRPEPELKLDPEPAQLALPAYLTETQQKIYAVLGSGEVFTADLIAAQSGLPLPAVLADLTRMEIFGLVRIHPGRRFSL